jgi:hypothetical protein
LISPKLTRWELEALRRVAAAHTYGLGEEGCPFVFVPGRRVASFVALLGRGWLTSESCCLDDDLDREACGYVLTEAGKAACVELGISVEPAEVWL